MAFVAFLCAKTNASHIIGGELSYDQIGNGVYRITLKIFRDCGPNSLVGFDGTGTNPPATINVFDIGGNQVLQLDAGTPTITLVAGSINSACVFINHPCVEQGLYIVTATLSPIAGGYTLVHQRCCRNTGVLNLTSGLGSSFTAFIPGPELAVTNSSPRFTNLPPIDICNNLDLVFDHSATDADGDTLIYYFCKPFDGVDNCCAVVAPNIVNPCNTSVLCPSVALPPPYPDVTYIGGFDENYPVPSNPSLTINSNSGLLIGKPNLQGLYAVGVCVEEWRNGNLLSKHYRDFQFAVKACTVSVAAAIADQSQKCQGQTITFTNTSVNQSNNPNYFWDFGDPNLTNDTSIVKNPSYTYQDTGTYLVTLIVNKGGLCNDTLKKLIYVYPPLNINFTKPTVHCLKSSSVNFSAGGTFLPNKCTYSWNFPSANPATSTLQSPTGVQFTTAGLFSVTLIIKQFACEDTCIDSIRILNRPIAKINNFPTQLCDPGRISFSNGSISEYASSYFWQMSDGSSYFAYEPTHTFSPAGNYNVVLTMIRTGICPDTSIAVFSSITINPLPVPGFIATPSVTSIFDPEILVQNTSDAGVMNWNYTFGDGTSATYSSAFHTYIAPGKYKITQTVTNSFSCVASTQKEIIIKPEFRFWVPNAFSPDENNLNETFTPISIGVSNYKFMIFDQWGHLLFETAEPNTGWDGKVKGIMSQQDIYIWKAQFLNDVSEKKESRVGSFILLNDSGEF